METTTTTTTASAVTAPAFPATYATALAAIADAIAAGRQDTIADAFAALGALRPAKPSFDGMTREARREALDDLRAAQGMHARALREAFRLARDGGATLAVRHGGSVTKGGTVNVRETVTATFRTRERASVRL